MHISVTAFESAVEKTLGMIPEMFRAHLNNMTISVEDQPSPDLLREMGMSPHETLFGVYTGVPLPERSAIEPPIYPDEIIIFREPLMAACSNRDELETEIAITVVHELAHYMGLSEERLAELGWD
jgi:predicted Zn-dependent protease with MMP-like domain